MLRSYVPLGAAVALCLASAACAAPTSDATAAGFVAPAPPPEIEEDLSVSVDLVDVRHGSLRIEASMVGGSADVSMWLGPTCETREVGRGFATPSGFAWSLTRDEIARAIECNLVVRARGVDEEGHRVRMTATLPVAVSLVADEVEQVGLFRQEAAGRSTKMTFAGPVRVNRLHVAGSIIGREVDDDGLGPRGRVTSTFVVGNDDLALAMVARRRITTAGDSFFAAITVGGATLDVSNPEPEAPAAPEVVVDVSSGDVDEPAETRARFYGMRFVRSQDEDEYEDRGGY